MPSRLRSAGPPHPAPALLLAAASAAAYGLTFPPVAWRGAAWVALVPLLIAVRRAGTLPTTLAAGWVWTIVAAYTVGDWFPRAISTYYAQPIWVGAAFFFGVSTFTAAVHYMTFAAVYRHAAPALPPAIRPLLAAAAWVAAEYGRAETGVADPWALAGYSQAAFPVLVQVADLGGVYPVSAALVAVNAAVAEWWVAWRRGEHFRLLDACPAGALALAVALYGVVRLHGVPAVAAPAVPVAVVQGNQDVGAQWRPEAYGDTLDAYLRLTARVLRESRAPLVVWPESAMTFFVDREPGYRDAIARITAPHAAQVLAGGTRATDDAPPRYFNTAFLLAAGGAVHARYDKRQLLPFAEYFPLRTIEIMRRRFGRVREFTPGEPGPPLATPAGRAGVLICNEAVFPAIARARVREGAEWLANLANDTWVGEPKFAAIMFDMVRLRAIEQRRWLVRASTSGPSAIVDPAGRVAVGSTPFQAEAIHGTIERRTGLTPYARLGDAFALACAGLTVLGLLAVRRRRGAASGP